jgi:hypothetical protein
MSSLSPPPSDQTFIPRQVSFFPPLKNLETENSTTDPPGTIRGKVVDNFDGTYTVTYRLTTLGSYKVHITLYGVHIRGSPFDLVAGSGIPFHIDISLTIISTLQRFQLKTLWMTCH